MISLVMSALVAGLTVGGKAIGKTFAVNSSTKIVHFVGKTIYWVKHFPELLSNKINHPTREMNKLFAYELVRTMFYM